jgi:hypothetical protein
VKLVDTPDLGSGTERCGGSSPFTRSSFRFFVFRQKVFFCISNLTRIFKFPLFLLLLFFFLGTSEGGVHKRPKQFRILIAGDVMFDWGLRETMEKKGAYFPIEGLLPLFEEADIKMVNLETPVSTLASPDTRKPYVFNAKPEELNLLNRLDIDMVFLANNHSMDYGKEGLSETIQNLTTKGILHVGAGNTIEDAYKPKIIHSKNNSLRIVSANAIGEQRLFATKNSPGAAPYSVPVLSKIPDNSKDFHILSLHWGIEYNPEPTKEQIAGARKLISSGFQVVVGHHPHIPQGVEKYNDGLILYSLGNFLFGSRNQYLNHNLAVMLYVQNNKLTLCELIPIFGKFQQGEHRIYPLEGEDATEFLGEIAHLSEKLNTRILIRNGRGYIYF